MRTPGATPADPASRKLPQAWRGEAVVGPLQTAAPGPVQTAAPSGRRTTLIWLRVCIDAVAFLAMMTERLLCPLVLA